MATWWCPSVVRIPASQIGKRQIYECWANVAANEYSPTPPRARKRPLPRKSPQTTSLRRSQRSLLRKRPERRRKKKRRTRMMTSPRTRRKSLKHVSGYTRYIPQKSLPRVIGHDSLSRATQTKRTTRADRAYELQNAPSLSSAPPPSTTTTSASSVSLASRMRTVPRRTAWRSVSRMSLAHPFGSRATM